MIFSRQSIYIVDLLSKDSSIEILNAVIFDKHGALIAANRNTIIAIDSVGIDKKEILPLSETVLIRNVALSIANVKKILNSLPADTIFKGMLEYFDLCLNENGQAVITMHDGTQEHRIVCNPLKTAFEYEKVLCLALSRINTKYDTIDNGRFCLSLSRLLSTLSTISKVIGDKSGEIPLYMTLMDKPKQLVFKILGPKTGQLVYGVMSVPSFDKEGIFWAKQAKMEQFLLSR